MSKLRLAGQLGKWLKSGGELLAGPASLGRGEQLANLAYRFGPEQRGFGLVEWRSRSDQMFDV